MTPTDQIVPSRVSILARLIPSFSYALPAFGSALSALLFVGVLRAMRYAEAAGIAAISGGMSEANIAIVAALYLAVFVGLIGIVVGIVRCVSTTTTASPSSWFFLVTAMIGLAPVLTLWQAESFFLGALTSRSGPGMISVIRLIDTCLTLTLGLAAVGVVVLLVASLIPLPAFLRAKQKWAPVIFLVLMELALIVMTVLFHLRTAWFYNVKLSETY
jgi:hypothetical protein